MTESSQTPPGALPLDAAHTAPRVAPLTAARFATFDLAIPAPAGPVPSAPDVPASPVAAAAGVLDAAQHRGLTTPEELAQAEAEAGLLFDPQIAQDIAEAAAAQAHAEDEAEIAERGRQLARMAGTLRQHNAVVRLLEGRPGTDHLPVAAIAAAAEYGTTPYDDLPMTVRWTGAIAAAELGRVIVRCESPYGGRADLVVDGPDRARLASLVDAQPRVVPGPCPTDGCGTAGDYDPSDPAMLGWARVEVAGLDDGPCWYCSPTCVADALARAGEELAADDQAAAADVARCVRCGCTEEQACEGGCAWVPNRQMVDLCSACATPAELAAAGWRTGGGQ
ncbi:hypothetical protein AB0G64_09265 [Streptomyces longwoodensis]|uniref:hypothetical protein n=1 Tax=Streptomyces longwoodensis TaxID=68231 RepID=UPI0033C48AB8